MGEEVTEEARNYFERAGLTSAQTEALYSIWHVDLLEDVPSPDASGMRSEGHPLHAIFDARAHDLAYEQVLAFDIDDFTMHQVALIHTSDTALRILERRASNCRRRSIPA